MFALVIGSCWQLTPEFRQHSAHLSEPGKRPVKMKFKKMLLISIKDNEMKSVLTYAFIPSAAAGGSLCARWIIVPGIGIRLA